MEKFNALVMTLLISLSCFGQKSIIHTMEDNKLMVRNQAITLEALSCLSDKGMKECISYPGDYSVAIVIEWQVDSGFQPKKMTFKRFNNVDERYKQQDWYRELGLDCTEKIFWTDGISRTPILNAWCNEIIKLTEADTIYAFITPEWLPYGKTKVEEMNYFLLYGTRNHWKTEYRRTDTTDLEQWIKRMKQLKLRDAFLEYEKQKKAHSKNKDSHNERKSLPGCVIY